jgi:hypothetical protein
MNGHEVKMVPYVIFTGGRTGPLEFGIHQSTPKTTTHNQSEHDTMDDVVVEEDHDDAVAVAAAVLLEEDDDNDDSNNDEDDAEEEEDFWNKIPTTEDIIEVRGVSHGTVVTINHWQKSRFQFHTTKNLDDLVESSQRLVDASLDDLFLLTVHCSLPSPPSTPILIQHALARTHHEDETIKSSSIRMA